MSQQNVKEAQAQSPKKELPLRALGGVFYTNRMGVAVHAVRGDVVDPCDDDLKHLLSNKSIERSE